MFSGLRMSDCSHPCIYNKVNGQGIPCGRNSYSFIPILSKLQWCLCHGLKICIWFGYNPQIILSLFLQVELSHISSLIYNKVNKQGITCGRNSYSFIPIFSRVFQTKIPVIKIGL